MIKEVFKEKLHAEIEDVIYKCAHIPAFDFKETDSSDDDFILGTIVYSRGYLAISTSRWDASSYALNSCAMEIFDWFTEWDEAFEFFWKKILMVENWDNKDYEEQLIFEHEKNCIGSYFVVKGRRFGD